MANAMSPHRRFWEKVVNGENGCWRFTGCINLWGYGTMKINGRSFLAHRLAFLEIVGDIPDGLVLDHLCRQRDCVNPRHLEPVTIQENIMRGFGACAQYARRTHCSRGHGLSPENIYPTKNTKHRRCKECHKMRGKLDKYKVSRRVAYVKRMQDPVKRELKDEANKKAQNNRIVRRGQQAMLERQGGQP